MKGEHDMPNSFEGRGHLLCCCRHTGGQVPDTSYHWFVCCAWERLAANSATNRPSATTDRCMVLGDAINRGVGSTGSELEEACVAKAAFRSVEILINQSRFVPTDVLLSGDSQLGKTVGAFLNNRAFGQFGHDCSSHTV